MMESLDVQCIGQSIVPYSTTNQGRHLVTTKFDPRTDIVKYL